MRFHHTWNGVCLDSMGSQCFQLRKKYLSTQRFKIMYIENIKSIHCLTIYVLLQRRPTTYLLPRGNRLMKDVTNHPQSRPSTPHFITEKQINYIFLSVLYRCHKNTADLTVALCSPAGSCLYTWHAKFEWHHFECILKNVWNNLFCHSHFK